MKGRIRPTKPFAGPLPLGVFEYFSDKLTYPSKREDLAGEKGIDYGTQKAVEGNDDHA